MILLNVRPYCENCEDFEPEIERTVIEDFFGNTECSTVVKCENMNKCESIMKYLKSSGVENERPKKQTQHKD